MSGSRTWAAVVAMSALAGWSMGIAALGQEQDFGAGGAGVEGPGVEVMTRGPVHEAFAQPITGGKVSPVVVSKKPPEIIEEVPPDVKPEGEEAIWIGGYWAWDDDRSDFTWISGVWRVPPPGHFWVAGYWSGVPGGYGWVSGFWSPAEEQQVAYYPEPPASVEEGPSGDAPSTNHVWTSGYWQWRDDRYAWRPGHWIEGRPNWVWISPSYYWSPRGWVFCNGFWDYDIIRRGTIFAPVYFATPVYRRPNYFYTPSVVVNLNVFSFYLFVRPSYGHYYFGDYYATNYDRIGIYPWFAVRQHRGYRYDPLFTYYDWRHRDRDPNWSRSLRDWHTYYRNHPDHRPPHTYAATQRLMAGIDRSDRPDRQYLRLADTVQHWRERPQADMRFADISREQKGKYEQTARLMRQLERERGQIEAAGDAVRRGDPRVRGQAKGPETLRLPTVARNITESLPTGREGGRPGGTRETMRPVTPPAGGEAGERDAERRRVPQSDVQRDEDRERRGDVQRRASARPEGRDVQPPAQPQRDRSERPESRQPDVQQRERVAPRPEGTTPRAEGRRAPQGPDGPGASPRSDGRRETPRQVTPERPAERQVPPRQMQSEGRGRQEPQAEARRSDDREVRRPPQGQEREVRRPPETGRRQPEPEARKPAADTPRRSEGSGMRQDREVRRPVSPAEPRNPPEARKTERGVRGPERVTSDRVAPDRDRTVDRGVSRPARVESPPPRAEKSPATPQRVDRGDSRQNVGRRDTLQRDRPGAGDQGRSPDRGGRGDDDEAGRRGAGRR